MNARVPRFVNLSAAKIMMSAANTTPIMTAIRPVSLMILPASLSPRMGAWYAHSR